MLKAWKLLRHFKCEIRLGKWFGMKVILIRHGKVNMRWQKRYTSEAYDQACRRYDLSSILPVHGQRKDICQETIYVSTLPRSRQTAEQLFGEQTFTESRLLNEVPLRSFCDCKLALPLWLWNVGGRLQWLWSDRRQKEGRAATVSRARRLVSSLLHKNRDCILVTHGFYMRVLVKELKKQGFKIEKSQKGYENLAQIIATK